MKTLQIKDKFEFLSFRKYKLKNNNNNNNKLVLLHKYPPSAHKHDKAVLGGRQQDAGIRNLDTAVTQSRFWPPTMLFTSGGILEKLPNLTDARFPEL